MKTTNLKTSNFYKKVERLEETLGIKLTTNIWHKHFSVYTVGDSGSNQYQLVCSDTLRGATAQLSAVLDTLYAAEKLKSGGTK